MWVIEEGLFQERSNTRLQLQNNKYYICWFYVLKSLLNRANNSFWRKINYVMRAFSFIWPNNKSNNIIQKYNGKNLFPVAISCAIAHFGNRPEKELPYPLWKIVIRKFPALMNCVRFPSNEKHHRNTRRNRTILGVRGLARSLWLSKILGMGGESRVGMTYSTLQ